MYPMSLVGVNWGVLGISAGGAAVVALAGGVLTEIGPWYRSLRKPSWQPPEWLFGPAWTTIFVLAAWAAALAWVRAPTGQVALRSAILFGINAVLNIAWSLLFFRLRRPDWALAEVVPLWLSIGVLMVAISGYTPLGTVLLAPYLAWVSFAAFLNMTIVRLNRPFVGS